MCINYCGRTWHIIPRTLTAVPRFLPEEGCLSGGERGGGVRVAVAREHLFLKVLFYETKGSAGKGWRIMTDCSVQLVDTNN